MPVEPYLLIVYTFAAASVARLVVVDDLLERPRDWLVGALDRVRGNAAAWTKAAREWLDDRPRTVGRTVATLIALGLGLVRFGCWFGVKVLTCIWCASFWVSLGTVALVWWHGHNPVMIFVSLAFAMRLAASTLVQIGR